MKPHRQQQDLFSLPPEPEPPAPQIRTFVPPPRRNEPSPLPASADPVSEHQLHHAGKICIISHRRSALVVAVIVDGHTLSSFDWDTLDAFVAHTEIVPQTSCVPGAVLAPLYRITDLPAQLANDYAALFCYAKEYTRFEEVRPSYFA